MLDMIGERLRELRESAGLDQPAFAKIAKTTKQYVWRLEKGLNKDPNPKFIERWAKHFRVRMEWITTGKLPKEASLPPAIEVDPEVVSLALSVTGALATKAGFSGNLLDKPWIAAAIAAGIEELSSSQLPDEENVARAQLRIAEIIGYTGGGDGQRADGTGSSTDRTKVGSKAFEASRGKVRGKGLPS